MSIQTWIECAPASIQLRERTIACSRMSRSLGSMVQCSAGARAVPFLGRRFWEKGIVSLVGEVDDLLRSKTTSPVAPVSHRRAAAGW
jgi:hypothetical protein